MSIPTWLEYANALGTLAAAGFAAFAIKQAAKTGDENQRALIRERRIDYELDLLAEILSEMAHMRSAEDRPKITLLARTLPVELVPLTRTAFGLDSTPQADLTVRNTGWTPGGFFPESLLDALRDEVAGAVTSRLTERNLPASASRWRFRR